MTAPRRASRQGWRKAARGCAIVLLTAAAGACSSSKDEVSNPNIRPLEYKADVLLEMPRILGDPTNIRDAYISDPLFDPNGPIKHYYSCVRFNPRDPGTRQYLGSRDYIAHYFDGHLNQFVAATKEQCASAAYKPFPELEKLCKGHKCS
jgi:hypothetical protein